MEVVIGLVFSVVFFMFFLQNKAGLEAQSPERVAEPAVAGVAGSVGLQKSNETAMPEVHLPQDPVLRRHFATHVRQMVEDLSGPQPSESVLRRHYEQLVASRVEECLASRERLESLTTAFDAFRRVA